MQHWYMFAKLSLNTPCKVLIIHGIPVNSFKYKPQVTLVNDLHMLNVWLRPTLRPTLRPMLRPMLRPNQDNSH